MAIETAAVEQVVQQTSVFAEHILPILIPTVAAIIAAVGAFVIAYIKKWSDKLLERMNASDAERQAVEALMAGMELAQEEIVNDLKIKAADGKLTADERREVLDFAIERAKALAKGPALEVLKASSRERLGAWAKQILAKWK
jgi:hypothetical protein